MTLLFFFLVGIVLILLAYFLYRSDAIDFSEKSICYLFCSLVSILVLYFFALGFSFFFW